MKVLAIVAVFAFVAVQMSHSAPAPEEEKKEAVVAAAAAVEATPQPIAEVKSGAAEAAVNPSEPVPHAEEKKA